MNKKNDIVIFLSGSYHSPIWNVEQYLPYFLSKYRKVYCIEHPYIRNNLRILTHKSKLIERVSPNLTIFHSVLLIPGRRMFKKMISVNYWYNFLIFQSRLNYKIQQADIVTFTPETATISKQIKDQRITYYAIDDYPLVYWKNQWRTRLFRILEKEILKISRTVLVNSKSILDKYKKMHKNVKLSTVPVNLKYFIHKNKFKEPLDLRGIRKPIVGYIGTINKIRIDTKLLEKLLTAFPYLSFVFIGNINGDIKYFNSLNNYRNYHFLGIKKLELLYNYLKYFSVCIIPYNLKQFGQTSFPTKIIEHFAVGKPVVTTALPAIKDYWDKGLIYWAKTHEEFKKFLIKALNEEKDKKLLEKRIKEAQKNDWPKRIKEFLELINNSSR